MGNGEPSIRTFVALDLDAMSVRRVGRVTERLRMASGAPSAAWTPPHKVHVTLKFMAAFPTERVGALVGGLRGVVESARPPAPSPMRLGAFPNVREARIVVVGLDDPDGGLAELARRVDGVAQGLGAPRDDRAFRPHVTLARLKRPYDARRWLKPEIAFDAGGCRAAGVTLFRSDLGSAGSTYVSLAQFCFGDAGL